jgi:xanthine dehydrogenase YagT iron-sulfur-binding subunit
MQDYSKGAAATLECSEVSRRSLLTSGLSAAVAGSLVSAAHGGAQAQPVSQNAKPQNTNLSHLTINGRTYDLAVDPRTSLLDAIREQAGLTGTKKGCDHGQCGACTVLVGGARILSCLTLAVSVRQPVTTIEGLAPANGQLHPMQQAFLDKDALQCGYCTPGQIMSAVACVKEGHARSDDEIREYMSGNLCRCAAYPNIVAAINQAKTEMGRT